MYPRIVSLFVLVMSLAFMGCSEPAFRLHEKLESTLQEDLKFIVGEVMKGSGKTYLLDEPYFEIQDLRFFEGDTARIYSGYAEVDFYYFKDIDIKQRRKYRYDARYRHWDRYFKKLEFMNKPDKSSQVIEK